LVKKDIPQSAKGLPLCALCRDEGKGDVEASDIYVVDCPNKERRAVSVCFEHTDSIDKEASEYRGWKLIWAIPDYRLDYDIREVR
jgi:hypothetical protein